MWRKPTKAEVEYLAPRYAKDIAVDSAATLALTASVLLVVYLAYKVLWILGAMVMVASFTGIWSRHLISAVQAGDFEVLDVSGEKVVVLDGIEHSVRDLQIPSYAVAIHTRFAQTHVYAVPTEKYKEE